jgi:HicB_like antitoxin of bacterial toxin-antitoxin system
MGADENEAYANAIAALDEWMRDAQAAGGRPAARGIEALRRDPDVNAAVAEGAIFLRIPYVNESGRPVKANISLDQGLLDAIDAAARSSGLTRSAFLASAAREKIAASG